MSSSNEGPVGALRMVGIDVADLDRSKQFWGEMLGLEEESRGPEYLLFVRRPGEPIIYLQKVPEKKIIKNRMHFDIAVEDLDAAVARAYSMGATRSQTIPGGGPHVAVLEDPDGNEFCLVKH